MYDILKTINVDGYTINIYHDDAVESPRDWDNMGTFICAHRRYGLGDVNVMSSEGLKEARSHIQKGAVVLPVYLYDHSGITLSTSPFSCPWDSGQVGVIYANPDKIRNAYGCKRITKKMREVVKWVLDNEIQAMDQYVRGDVFRFEILDKDGGWKEGLGGMYGLELCIDEAMDSLKQIQQQPLTP